MERGIRLCPHKRLSDDDFKSWFLAKVDDLEAIVNSLMVSSTESLQQSLDSSDASEILKLVNHIDQAFDAILVWEEDVKFTTFPPGVKAYKSKVSGWAYHFINDIKRIPEEIMKVYANKPETGAHSINLVFSLSSNFVSVHHQIMETQDLTEEHLNS